MKNKEKYWYRKENKLCTRCGTDDSLENSSKTLCGSCYRYLSRTRKVYYQKTKEHYNLVRKEQRELAKTQGLCIDCNTREIREDSVSRCNHCLEKCQESNKKSRVLNQVGPSDTIHFMVSLRERFTTLE